MFKFLNCFFCGYLLLCSIAFAEADSKTCVFPDAPDVQAPDWICSGFAADDKTNLFVGIGDGRTRAVFDALRWMADGEGTVYMSSGEPEAGQNKSEAVGSPSIKDEVAARQEEAARKFWQEMIDETISDPEEEAPQVTESYWKKRFGKSLLVKGTFTEIMHGSGTGSTLEAVSSGDLIFRDGDCHIALQRNQELKGSSASDETFESNWQSSFQNCDINRLFEILPTLDVEVYAETVSPGRSYYIALMYKPYIQPEGK